MEKISAVYRITNIVTGDFYIGSSKDVKQRWRTHKSPSRWKERPNILMYQDMQKYGVDKFRFQILEVVEPGHLTQVEQDYIDLMKPSYNKYNAKGVNIERHRENIKEYTKEYRQTEKNKKYMKEYHKDYYNQLCSYNGEELTLGALRGRFKRVGIKHPTSEAKKYLIKN